MEIGPIVGIASAVGALALYVIRSELQKDVTRLDGRINTHERGCEQRQLSIDRQLAALRETAERSEDKIDRLIEHQHGA